MSPIQRSELSPFFYPSDLGVLSADYLPSSPGLSPVKFNLPTQANPVEPGTEDLPPATFARSPAPSPGNSIPTASRSYAEVVAKSPSRASLPSPSSGKSGSVSSVSSVNSAPGERASARRVAERLHGIKLVHVLGLPHKKIGQLRQHMAGMNFRVKDIINMSYISNQVVECLVRQTGYKAFRKSIRKNALSAFEQYDPSNSRDSSLNVFLDESIRTMSSRQILTEFIKRIATESNKTRDLIAKAFFASWAAGLNKSNEYYLIAKRPEQQSNRVNPWR